MGQAVKEMHPRAQAPPGISNKGKCLLAQTLWAKSAETVSWHVSVMSCHVPSCSPALHCRAPMDTQNPSNPPKLSLPCSVTQPYQSIFPNPTQPAVPKVPCSVDALMDNTPFDALELYISPCNPSIPCVGAPRKIDQYRDNPFCC